MDESRFTSTQFGQIFRTPGPYGFLTYLPAPLPRQLELTSPTVAALSDADRALGRLAGAGRLLPNPHLLVNAYIAREALASSRIEGTQATLSDVLEAETQGSTSSTDVAEVLNYIRAMNSGLSGLDSLPMSKRMIEEIHAILMAGVRGQERSPGEIRRSPNWIGSPDNRPATAAFVPPPVDEMARGLSDWERFWHDERATLPPLVRCALLHYQFETLHPFLDGNGRLGRLLIVFFLVSQGHLPQPFLYVSSYFEEHKDTYYSRLQAVRERAEMQEWLQFFLGAVESQATDAIARAERLTDLRESFRERLHGRRSRAPEAVDLLFENPFLTPSRLSQRLQMTPQGATKLLEQLEASGIVTAPRLRVRGRPGRWVAQEVLEIIR